VWLELRNKNYERVARKEDEMDGFVEYGVRKEEKFDKKTVWERI
jgi:hypothetical protein